MNDTPDAGFPAEDVRLAALAGATPEAAASPDARARARRAFLTGGTRAAGSRRRRVPPVAALALAAAFAGAVFLLARPDGVPAGRTVTVAADAAAPEQFDLGATLRVRVSPGSRVVLPAERGADAATLRVEEGEVLASTGDRPLGRTLRVVTPEAVTVVTGTTFAVRRNALGTCVCLLEGAVSVEDLGRGTVESVPPGQRLQVHRDGRAAAIEPLDAGEADTLARLREEALGAAR